MPKFSPNLCCMLAKLNMQHMGLETRQRTVMHILERNGCSSSELLSHVEGNGSAKAKRNVRALLASLERV